MNEIKFLKAYVIYVVVGFIAGAIVGAIQGAILGAVLGALGHPMENIPLITAVTGFLFGVFVSFFVFRWNIRKFILTQLNQAQQNGSEPVDTDNQITRP
jgi:uncharacterized protein HemY